MVVFEVVRDINGSVMHDFVNATFGNGKAAPHEWYFLSVLSREEILNNKEMADAFVMYVFQYYPEYRWSFFKQDDYLATAVVECEFKAFQFQQKYEFGFDFDESKDNYLAQSMVLGDIVTDFLIRYRNYSLIKCSGQKIILTAQSDCHKRFEEYLSKGYSLQRRAKVGYIKKPEIFDDFGFYPEAKDFFYKLPVLPTRDIGYDIDEIIETNNEKYKQVMQLSKRR